MRGSAVSKVFVAFVVGFGMVSCGQSPVDHPDTAAVADAEAKLAQLYSRVSGSRAERSAGAYVVYRLYQDGVRACMNAAGWKYRPPAFLDQWATWESDAGTGDTEWLTPLTLTPVTRPAQALAVLQRAHAREGTQPSAATELSGAERRRYGQALSSCMGPNNGYQDADHPALAVKLVSALGTMIERVDRELSGYAASYRACLRAAGVNVADRHDLLAQIEQALPADPKDMPAPGAPDTPQWSRAKAVEAPLAAADVKCRRPVRDRGYMLLAPRIGEFQREHAAELVAVDREWDKLTTRAAVLLRQ